MPCDLESMFEEIEREHRERLADLQERYCQLVVHLHEGKQPKRKEVLLVLRETRKTPTDLRLDVATYGRMRERVALVARLDDLRADHAQATEELRALQEEWKKIQREYEAKAGDIGVRRSAAEHQIDRALQAQLALRHDQHLAEEVRAVERELFDLTGKWDAENPEEELRAEIHATRARLDGLNTDADAGRLLRRAFFPLIPEPENDTPTVEGCSWLTRT